MKEFITKLEKVGACTEAIHWCSHFPTLQEAWKNCERGDWMLWLVGKLSGEPGGDARKKLVLTACQCARLSLKYVKAGESRPLKAIEAAEKWANGNTSISLEDVRKAVAAAAYAAYAAAYAVAAAAADAVAAAADADAAYAAAYADAAAAAADAAYAVAAADAVAADADAAYAAAYAVAADAVAAAADAVAADADAAAAAAYVRKNTLKKCADIVRKYYPEVPEIE